MTDTQALDFVLFGGTGDLAMRKLLPALFQLRRDGLLPAEARIIGVAREALDQGGYRVLARDRAGQFLGAGSTAEWAEFTAGLDYACVDALDGSSFAALATALDGNRDRARVFYLSTAPALFSAICRHLDAAALITRDSRVVLEKPLGHDLASSRQINDQVGSHFEEGQIYRIDHYLGKEPVQNLLALRFGNVLFEPLWRREWVRDVQITVAEQVGVEARGGFYDKTGAMRDMVQNHLLQLLCIVAMEPPARISSDAVRDEKLKILRALRPIDAAQVRTLTVRGQYQAGAVAGQQVPAYREEPGIAADSRTETFVALKARIDTWRWAGVPFYLRTGKRMPSRLAEIVIHFRQVPHSIFGGTSDASRGNRLVIRMQPEETVELHLQAKQPGEAMALRPVRLNLDFAETYRARRLEAYERLLMDVIRGNLTLFVRHDEQEAAWEWVEPILSAWDDWGESPEPYRAGTWGPAQASALPAHDHCHWHVQPGCPG